MPPQPLALVGCSATLGVRLIDDGSGVRRSERLPSRDKRVDAGICGQSLQNRDEVAAVQHRRRGAADGEAAGRLRTDALELCDELFELRENDVARSGHVKNCMDT
jgi:hypothetical protein